jgi:hypothetical protein
MYITPSLLSPQDWDVLAETAKWSRENAEVLKDSHWIGGDPARLEVYGWAAWSPDYVGPGLRPGQDGSKTRPHMGKAILTLRNPSDKPQDFTGSLAQLLELPDGTAPRFGARSPWNSDAAKPALTLPARERHSFHLEPFQVITLELVPSS